jgi:hypothetical protein
MLSSSYQTVLLLKKGETMSNQQLKPFMLRFEPADKARLEHYSKRTRTPMAAIVYNATMHYLDEHETQADRVSRLAAPE